MDQFVPICSIEVNSSPVSPGYWPSQQEPPANPYTESKWERERERERGRKGAGVGTSEKDSWSQRKMGICRERRRPEMQRKRGRSRRGRKRERERESGKGEGVGGKTIKEGDRGTGADQQIIPLLHQAGVKRMEQIQIVMPQSPAANWHWNKGSDTWASFRGSNRGQYCLLLGKGLADVTQLMWITESCYQWVIFSRDNKGWRCPWRQ